MALDLAETGPVPVVALLDQGTAGQAPELVSAGVADVLQIQWLESLLLKRLKPLLQTPAPARPQPPTKKYLRKRDVLIGESHALMAVMRQLDMVARSDIGVLVRGETGTGKELVARTLHATGVRQAAPFVVANCTALPEQLFENELFGHERGAYTGANKRQEGLIAAAEGGSLLLDEIGEISPGIQAKLLRLMQFHEYKRIGGTATLTANVRILATTHRDLRRLVAEGEFRQDLYYRMNTLEIVLPPLRERVEDIPLLVDHFVRLYAQQTGRPAGAPLQRLTADAIAKLYSHDWPGNIRELENVINRCLVMSAGFLIEASDVHLYGTDLGHNATDAVTAAQAPLDLSRSFADQKAQAISDFEERYLRALLSQTAGNLSKAARIAQHERKSLWRLLKKHNIALDEYRSKG